jgi:hypothetical protein
MGEGAGRGGLMQVGRVSGCTRVRGYSQGYTGLPVRDEVFDLGDRCVRATRSAWFPSPDEIARLNAGAPVYLVLLTSRHPPVLIDVGEVPDGEPTPP